MSRKEDVQKLILTHQRRLQKLKEKEAKSLEQKNKTITQIKEKIERFQEKEQKKYFSAKQNSCVRNK